MFLCFLAQILKSLFWAYPLLTQLCKVLLYVIGFLTAFFWWHRNWISPFRLSHAYNNPWYCVWCTHPHAFCTGCNASKNWLSWGPLPKIWYQVTSSLSCPFEKLLWKILTWPSHGYKHAQLPQETFRSERKSFGVIPFSLKLFCSCHWIGHILSTWLPSSASVNRTFSGLVAALNLGLL